MLAETVAMMIESVGYEPFIWDADMFGVNYKLVRVDPLGVLIDVTGNDTTIAIGVTFTGNFRYEGGTKFDIADPKSTEVRFKGLIEEHAGRI